MGLLRIWKVKRTSFVGLAIASGGGGDGDGVLRVW